MMNIEYKPVTEKSGPPQRHCGVIITNGESFPILDLITPKTINHNGSNLVYCGDF